MTSISRFTLDGEVACVSVQPEPSAEALPVCLFLYGGGGQPENLVALAPLLAAGWAERTIALMVVACAGVPPFCFYVDEPAGGRDWEALVAERLLEAVRARFAVNDRAALVGISMGGYGALKIAFAQSEVFRAVAAVAPMIEPSLDPNATAWRNRFHYPPEVPSALLGATRDPGLFERDHPAARAARYATAIRANEQAIYFDAGSRDTLNAHDGAEFLHRALWQLDIVHEYHLLRDADHVGPSIAPRLERAFAWASAHLLDAPPLGEEVRSLHALLAPARDRALAIDPSTSRVYGIADWAADRRESRRSRSK